MKKVMITAIATLAIAAQAASFSWGGYIANTVYDTVDWFTSPEPAVTMYLVYLGNAMYAGPTTAEGLADLVQSAGSFAADVGGLVKDTLIPDQNQIDLYTAVKVYAGPESGINGWWAVFIFDAATPDYFGLHVASTSGLSDSTGAGNIKLDVGWGPGEFLDAGAFHIVPEPATAMLALAGIGMLIAQKRKRA